MKKTLIVTFLLIVSLSLLFTQAFASADQQNQYSSVSAKPQKSTRMPKVESTKASNPHKNMGATAQPETTLSPDETQVPEGTEVPDSGQPAGKHGKGNGNGNGKSGDQPGGQPEEKGKPAKANDVLNGSITSVDGNTVVITLKDGSTVTITLDANTALKVPSLKDPTGYTFKPGQHLVVKVTQNEDGTYTAAQAHLIPGKPEKVHRVGTVTEYIPGVSITVVDKSGGTSTFALTADTKILAEDGSGTLAVGSVVTIISPRDVTGGTLSARGIVVHPATEDSGEPKLPGGTLEPIATGTPTATATATSAETATPEGTATETTTETPTETPTATPTSTSSTGG